MAWVEGAKAAPKRLFLDWVTDGLQTEKMAEESHGGRIAKERYNYALTKLVPKLHPGMSEDELSMLTASLAKASKLDEVQTRICYLHAPTLLAEMADDRKGDDPEIAVQQGESRPSASGKGAQRREIASSSATFSGETPRNDGIAQISEDLPVRARIFQANLTRILTEHPEQLFFIGIEDDIGAAQKSQIMPLYKAVDEIQNLKGADGEPIFPNLMARRETAGKLAAMVSDLNRDGKLSLNNAFIGARKISVDGKVYDAIKGEDRAWISAIDDSRPGDYLPVFEAITLNMMAYLNADLMAIKNFYDAISDGPIDPAILQEMLRNRIIYLLPRATKFDTKQLRDLYELARQVYIAA